MEFKETQYSEEVTNEEEVLSDDEQINIEEEVTPVNLSVKKSMWLLMGLVIIAIIVMLFSRSACTGISNAKKARQNARAQTEADVNGGIPISSTGSKSQNNAENNPKSKEPDSARESSATPPKNSVEVEEAVSVKEELPEPSESGTTNEFSEQSESVLQLTDRVETNGLVSSKKVYKFKDSYIYGVEIVILVAEGNEVTCQYFCPYKTYSSVTVGDTLKVSYQKDVNGTVSIYSIG